MSDIFNMSDTWNAGGTTFTAIKMNVADTASAAASLLADLQVGASSKFKVDKTGIVTAAISYVAPTFQTPDLTVAGLPAAAAGNKGQRRHVTDALAPAFLAIVAAGGAVVTPVFSNGTNWVCG